MTEPLDRLTAALADRYRIERELGTGGMATVYLARDIRHERNVALKVLRPELAATLGSDRFLREIRIAANLTHPHILPLHDSGEAEGFLYYVMPYIEGESLRDRIAQQGELPVDEVARILKEVVDALAHAHAQGVVHRDIKPDNVLLSGRHALVSDFGVAKALSEATGRDKLTTAGVSLGTPAYMAPEQASADPHIDHRADIYATGVLAYELLTGRPPFTGATQQMVLAAHVTETPEPVTKHRAAVPPAMAEFVMRCLEKKPADRWQSADELLREIEALTTPSGGVTPTATRPLAPAGPDRSRLPLLAAVVGGLAIAAATVWWMGMPSHAEGDLDPNLVAVFPFRISGDEQLAYLSEGIVDLLQNNLTGDGGPRAVASQTAISAWKRSGGSEEDDLTQEEAQTVARALGAALLIQGSIVGSPDNVILSASLLPADDGDDPIQTTVSGPLDSVAVLTGRLTAKLLTLRAGEEAERVSTLATVPLPALRAYLQGQIALREARYEDALDEFGHALGIDSTFALAGLSHAIARSWVQTAPPSPGGRIAWEHRDQLGDRDRLLLEAWRARPPGQPIAVTDRLAAAERAATMLGDRPEAWYFVGDRIFHRGEMLGMSRRQVAERAWAAFDRALELDPAFGPILTHKFDQAIWVDEDTLRLRRLVDSFPDIASVDLRISVAVASALDDTVALQRWRSGLSEYSYDELGQSAAGLFDRGRVGDALLAAKEGVRNATTAAQRWNAMSAQRTFQWESGQPRAAAELTQRIRRQLRPVPGANLRQLVFAALFADGDTTQAWEAIRELAASARAPLESDSAALGQVRDIYAIGLWHAARGEPGDARRMLAKLEPITDGSSDSYPSTYATAFVLQLAALLADPDDIRQAADRLDSLALTGPDIGPLNRNILNLVLTRVFESQGDVHRALAAVRRHEFFGALVQGTMYREEGRLAALTGDTEGAVWAYDQYLRKRGMAEPELRARDDAVRAELARLAGEGRN